MTDRKTRINQVMHDGTKLDRTPLMCQLSYAHIYKNLHVAPDGFWFSPEGMAEGYIQMAERYHFDGILVNAWHGIKPRKVMRLQRNPGACIVELDDGGIFLCPDDDDPRQLNVQEKGKPSSISELDPATVKVAETPFDIYPYFGNVLDIVMGKAAGEYSVHGEVGTAFEDFLELFQTWEDAFVALLEAPEQCHAVMERLNHNTMLCAVAQVRKGVDAVKLSSPFAGAGFISREMYREFILPYERELVDSIHREKADMPCYIHTCGAIGDRLDLMVETHADGLECLDPPPLGTVDLETAVEQYGNRLFIKGNLDSVHELLNLSPEQVAVVAAERLRIGRKCRRGYILSSACSVAPNVPPENILALAAAVEAEARQFVK